MTATTTSTRTWLSRGPRVLGTSPLPSLVAAALGFLAAALIAAGTTGPLRTTVVVVALLVVPGLPVVRMLGLREPVSRAALVVAASAAVDAVVALAMVWTRVWIPGPAAALLLLVAGWISLGQGLQTVETTARPARATRVRSTAALVRTVTAAGLLGTGVVLWAVGIAGTDTTDLGEWGLITALPPVWWVGALLVFGIALVTFLDRRHHVVLRAVSTGALVLVMYGTANLAAAEPRPPWVFKHIAVTAYILQHGGVDPSIDIYNRWPGFFSFCAFLGAAGANLDPSAPVRYAEIAFALVGGALVVGIARTLGLRGRWTYVAAALFGAANWVGQDYYSPQAFAFMLFLGALLVALTVLRGDPNRLGRWAESLSGRLLRARRAPVAVLPSEVSRTRTTTIAAVALIVVLQFVITASHQLTPFVVIAAFLPLLVLGYLRPRWLAVPIVLVPLLYVVPNLDYIQQKFGLTTGFDPVSNVTAASSSIAIPSLATTLQSKAVLAITAIVAVVAIVGLVRMIRAGHARRALLVLWLAACPVVLILGQSYGGEGKFRIVMFSAPFLAIAAAYAFHGRRLRLVAMSVVLATTTGLFLGATFQTEQANQTAPSEVAAAQWLNDHFTAKDDLTTVGDSFPAIIGGDYGNYLRHWGQVESLQSDSVWFPKGITAADLTKVLQDRDFGGDSWLVFSSTQRADTITRGILTGPQIDAIERSVASRATLRYDRDGVRIYEVVRAT